MSRSRPAVLRTYGSNSSRAFQPPLAQLVVEKIGPVALAIRATEALPIELGLNRVEHCAEQLVAIVHRGTCSQTCSHRERRPASARSPDRHSTRSPQRATARTTRRRQCSSSRRKRIPKGRGFRISWLVSLNSTRDRTVLRAVPPRDALGTRDDRRPAPTARARARALHQVLREHLATFLVRSNEQDGPGLPRCVTRELERALTCGVLAYGFARLRCTQCGQDELVAFSCKGRGFCPSCGGRRMADTAAHLVDEVLPEVRVRQWVLSFPYRIRFLLAFDPALCSGPVQRGARHLRPHHPGLAARARRGSRHARRQLGRGGPRSAVRRNRHGTHAAGEVRTELRSSAADGGRATYAPSFPTSCWST